MKRILTLIQQVYRYERKAGIETVYLRNVIILFSGILFILNIFTNSPLSQPGIFILTMLMCSVFVFMALSVNHIRHLKKAVCFCAVFFLLTSIYCICWGGNGGFTNTWYFLFPFVMLILIGLPVGVPFCFVYGLCTTIVFWNPHHNQVSGNYSFDYLFYYPLFYWSFFTVVCVADIFCKAYRIKSEETQSRMEEEVAATVKEAQKLIINSVAAISHMIDEKDSYTSEHSRRVAEYSLLIAQNLDHSPYSEAEQKQIYRCALLHDIGKIAVPDAILKKPAKLTDEEYALMKKHTVWGKEILTGLEFLPFADAVAGGHHERFDAKGYPCQIRSASLPEIVRIISAADALDAMSSNRCYRKQCDPDYILSEFENGSGRQFDPVIAQTVIRLIQNGTISFTTEESYERLF